MLDDFLPAEDVSAAQEDIARIYPAAEEAARRVAGDGPGAFDVRWDQEKPSFPFEGQSLNRLAVHDRLIDLAEQLLGTDHVRLYQGTVSAKYSAGADDYEQLLHADYGNHTLVVPRHEPGYQQLLLFVYLSDVTEGTAPTRIVSRSLTADIPVERTYLRYDKYADLYRAEVSATGGAGSVLAYRPDVFHRGTRLEAAGAARFLLHVAFKTADTDWVGFHTWPVRGEDFSWHRFVPLATVRQLTVLGFPPPGHPYWTAETLAGVAARYPDLDMDPWRRALAAGAGRG